MITLSFDPQQRLRYLVSNDCCVVCRLLSASEFVSFCKERDVDASVERLERFDQLRLFRPLARLRLPIVREKVEVDADGRRVPRGLLTDWEVREREVEEGYAAFGFEPARASWFVDNGHLWHPEARPFEAWGTKTRGHDDRRVEEAYYSQFQIRDLDWMNGWMTRHVPLDSIALSGAEGARRIAQALEDSGRDIAEDAISRRYDDSHAYLFQILSNRYFPLTQSDHRTYKISIPLRYPEWDWEEFRKGWDAKRVATDLGLVFDAIKEAQRHFASIARGLDPIGAWYDLVSFTSVVERGKLRGRVLYAQTLYSIEHMLRLFIRDSTGERLLPPDESPSWTKDDLYGAGVSDELIRHLEFLSNRYHLNPRPRLILLVEGIAESQAIPRIIEGLWGVRVDVLGIEIRDLGGVGGFTGEKRLDRYGALDRFIDDYHSRGTVVMMILDNEGRVSTVRRRLIAAQSRLCPGRALTVEDYIEVWNRNVEFDNFSDEEIASGLTATSDGRYAFAAKEVADCRSKCDTARRDHLSDLYHEKLRYDLPKPALLKHLVDSLLNNPGSEFDAAGRGKRPIVEMLRRAVTTARDADPAITDQHWQSLQKSGRFGKIQT